MKSNDVKIDEGIIVAEIAPHTSSETVPIVSWSMKCISQMEDIILCPIKGYRTSSGISQVNQ